jgi:hypothetical protein
MASEKLKAAFILLIIFTIVYLIIHGFLIAIHVDNLQNLMIIIVIDIIVILMVWYFVGIRKK